jgi:hypothetical protein
MTTVYPATSSSSATSSQGLIFDNQHYRHFDPSGGHIQATTACIKPGEEQSFLSTDRS